MAGLMTIVWTCGCYSLLNGWLSPMELGSFTRETTQDIRGSLSIQDTPGGLRGVVEPTSEDLVPTAEEYHAVAGDVLNVFIQELRERGVETAQQVTINSRGMINLPVLGWIEAERLTARDLEDKLRDILAERDVLYDAEVLVQFAAQRGLTYTIFGNESLAVRVNRGPGVFPIPRPDFRLIEAIAVSGGLSELVNEIYVFRKLQRDKAQAAALQAIQAAEESGQPSDEPPRSEERTFEPPGALPGVFPAISFSDRGPGMFASGRLFQIGGARRMQSSAPPGQQRDPTERRASDDAMENRSEVQDIIDLMGSQPFAGEPQKQGEVPPDDNRLQVEPPADQPPEPGPAVRQPTRWIYDPATRQWIEVTAERAAKQVGPILPPDEEGVQPVVDWETIAEGDHDVRIIRVSAEGLRQGDPRYNLVVRPGDVIRLFSGDIGFYYILGHVIRPGTFAFRSGATVTLKNAIAAAGGLDALAWPDRVTVYRRVGEREQMIQVNLDRIFAGVDPDFYLKRDDIVNVGTHPVAPFLLQLRNLTIPQLDSSASFSFIYRLTRQETFFRNENLDAPSGPGLFP